MHADFSIKKVHAAVSQLPCVISAFSVYATCQHATCFTAGTQLGDGVVMCELPVTLFSEQQQSGDRHCTNNPSNTNEVAIR
jgi:hypothetical protein